MSAEETAVMDQPVASQPPPATDGSAPWGSFYTAPAMGSGSTTTATPKKAKKSKKARRRATSDRRKASERREVGERREGAVEPASDRRAGADRREDWVESTTEDAKPNSRGLGSRSGGNRRVEDQRRSFRLRRGRRGEGLEAPAPAPASVAGATSRRYAEPHILVGIVGGTIIALAALMIALLYMIGNAA
jgi:hypothetical protein